MESKWFTVISLALITIVVLAIIDRLPYQGVRYEVQSEAGSKSVQQKLSEKLMDLIP